MRTTAPLSSIPPFKLSRALTDISILLVGAAQCPAYYAGLERRRPRGEPQEIPPRKSPLARAQGAPTIIATIRETVMNLIAVGTIIAALVAAAKTLSLDPLLKLR